MARADVIVIGAGHNGLTAAAYLARAGRSVTVLEQNERPGGLASLDEIVPGVSAPALFSTVDRLHPDVVAELQLQRHGLQIREGGDTLLLERGGRGLRLPADGPPDDVGDRDREAWVAFEAFLGRIAKALEPALAEGLPPVEPEGIGDLLDLLGLGWRLRRLGRAEMPAAMRLLPMAMRDVVEERFEDERLRAAIAWIGLAGGGVGPWAPGTALQLVFRRPAWAGGLFPAPRFAAGVGLGEALGSAAAAAGCSVRTGERVSRILVDDDQVRGVALESGEEIFSDVVVSATDPRTTLLELLEPGWLEADILAAARNIRASGTVSAVRIVLGAEPRLPGGSRSVGRFRIGGSVRYLEEASDAVKYHQLPDSPVIDATLPSAWCDGLAPAGRHLLHARVQYTPFELGEPGWEAGAGRLGERVIELLDEHIPGLARDVEAVDVLSPADIHRRFGLAGGHPFHVEPALDQALYMRPIPGCHDGRTPINGLYLGGPGIHPGGGVTGLPGRLCARRVLEDARRN